MAILIFLKAAVHAGTPLLFATLGEVLTEKSGNLNLGVEGLMLLGAVGGFAAGMLTQSALLAILAAIIAGALGGLIYAFLTVTLRANQVVTGLTLTIFGTGVAGYAGKLFMGQNLPTTIKSIFAEKAIPLLSKIPVLGTIFFQHNIFIYAGYLVAICMGIYLFKSRLGLNVRTVGESPQAADSSGIDVNLYKYVHILIGSAISALGGAYLSLVYVPVWQENITAGRGWIAVALVIFSMWNPYKAIAGAFLFGGLDIIGFRLQQIGFPVSQYVIDMVPYAITIIVLIFSSMYKKKDHSPKSLGVGYFREER
ncbi:ABC transporter permease [Clostridium sp. 'deep sea']|uniref:ABC transporter permease n=1 Tax=Clostridium sp. 'deep sea' TaxID=2779445 RepID=UPI0018964DD3|nr:ABC transporter permease [Clostridium sp. 'deep sea']QOR34198.1 ABC transporter permease [Clostridium sp. 'deep sea']